MWEGAGGRGVKHTPTPPTLPRRSSSSPGERAGRGAIRALVAPGGDEARCAVGPALADSDPIVRQNARLVLEALDGHAAARA